MAPRTIVKAALAAMVLSSADALRVQKRASSEGMVASKMMGEVPVYNYEYRGEAQQKSEGKFSAASAASYQWIVMLDAKSVDSFCGSEIACEQIGTKNGVPFVRVSATESALEEVLERHRGEVEFVEPDLPVEVIPEIVEPSPSSTQATPWSHTKVELSKASATGEGVHIYVMDTGVRTTHEEFGGRAVPTLDVFRSSKECALGDTRCAADTHGHGTHCAGTAGGQSYGVATGAIIHAMKVCCGGGSDLYGGMDWIVMGATKPAVMTMSLGSSGTPQTSRIAIDAVVNSGVTVFVSAGNSNINSCTKSYTFVRSAIGVGSIDPSNERSYFSNWGECNAIYAPGRNIPSASKDSDTGGKIMSGTSMAAPMVAGSAALLLQVNPSLSSAHIRLRLRDSAKSGVLYALRKGDPNLLLDLSSF